MSTQIQTQAKTPGRSSDAITARNAVKRNFSRQRGFSAELRHQLTQAKLKIGQPGDRYEQDADRVAEQVMAVSEPDGLLGTPVGGSPQVQRLCAGCEDDLQRQPLDEKEEEEEKKKKEDLLQMKAASSRSPAMPPHVGSQIRGLSSGRPLSTASRNFFEPRFGRDFSQVRIHAGSQAADAARAINARAFTRGHDVVFGTGQYAPETESGKELLAHELTHVIQQRGSAVHREAIGRKPLEEEEKDTIQAKAVPGRTPSVPPPVPAGSPALQGVGQPLSAPLRSFFEPLFNNDFSSVRTHDTPQGASLAQAADARAVTIGQDIAFAPRQYEPGTSAGRWLLGHELAHVAQQANSKGAASTGLGMLEAEADRAAVAAVSGQSFQVRHAAQPQQRLAVPVATGPGRVEIPSPDRIILTNFDIERATMKPEWLGAIGLATLILNLDPCKEAEIEGHTDSTGGETFNLNLSSNRANTIQQALEALVLEPAVASPMTLGFGEGRPIDTNATAAGRARNRRVEIRFVGRPLPNIDRVELLNSVASHTFVIPALAPIPASDHGVTVAREVATDARMHAVLNPPLNPGDRRAELIGWTGATQNPANPIEADISRAAGQNVAVAQISCPAAVLPASSAQFTVWSVDATIASAAPSAQVNPASGSRRLTMAGLTFNVLVTPVTLFSTVDASNMVGTATPATPAPGAGTPHPILGGDLAGGVNSRWDVSRRIRTRFIFPAHLTAAGLTASLPPIIGVPVPAYPADRLIGNDDRGTGDPEDNNPYVDGRMSGFDQLGFNVNNGVGNHGDTFVGRIHFQEFVRLDLGAQWRQISDDHPWKLHYSLVKFNLLGINFWRNAGSFGALDNAGF